MLNRLEEIKMLINLTELDEGKGAWVREIRGGNCLNTKMESMGIRAGKKIMKSGGLKTRGPQIVKFDNLQVAIGFGMAKHIMIEAE